MAWWRAGARVVAAPRRARVRTGRWQGQSAVRKDDGSSRYGEVRVPASRASQRLSRVFRYAGGAWPAAMVRRATRSRMPKRYRRQVYHATSLLSSMFLFSAVVMGAMCLKHAHISLSYNIYAFASHAVFSARGRRPLRAGAIVVTPYHCFKKRDR